MFRIYKPSISLKIQPKAERPLVQTAPIHAKPHAAPAGIRHFSVRHMSNIPPKHKTELELAPRKRSFFQNVEKRKMHVQMEKIETNQQLLREAEKLTEKGKFKEAERTYYQLIESDPKCKEAYDSLLKMWFEIGPYTLQQNRIDQLLSLYNENFPSLEENNFSLKPK